MTSGSASCGVRDRRAFLVVAAAFQAWVACSDPSSPSPSGSAPAGVPAAGSAADGGSEDCDRSPCASAGASIGHGGHPGAAGTVDVAGAAGTEDVAGSAGTEDIAGSAGTAGADDDGGSSGSSDDFVPAPHAPFPLVTAHGGPVLANIQLVPVYFGNDPLSADLERFNSWIVGSAFWRQTGAEYGVHAGTRLPAVQFASPTVASISDSDIVSWIDARVADGSLPKPSWNTVFALFYQAGTTITTATGTSCGAFAALHESAPIANQVFTGDMHFAIIPRCSYSPGDELMIATDVASHEFMESATNPLNLTNPGWIMDNDSGPLEAWGMLSGPAIADLCLSQSYDVIDGFTVQDFWSNAAAQAGKNPCQPSDPAHPFFSVSSDTTIYHAQPGATLTIHARAWSNQPAPDWELGINWGLVPSSDFDGQAVLSKTRVNNGDELTATITIPTNPPVTDGRSQYRFTIDSIDPINPNFSHPWPFLIVVP